MPGALSFSTDVHTHATLVAVARMYYLEERTQAEIAEFLEVSRPTVSRMLRLARERGVVQIRVVDVDTDGGPLAARVAEATGLRRVVVVAGDDDRTILQDRLGQAAARILTETVRDGDRVGIGWGRTVRAVAEALRPTRGQARVVSVPLLGGLGSIAPSFQVHEIASTVADAFGGAALSLYLPAIVEDETVRRLLLESPDAALILAEWHHLDVALVGIGTTAFDPEMQRLFSGPLGAASERFAEVGAVGDICMRFFDREGRSIPSLLDGAIALDLARLREVPAVIGVAGGAEKAEAILGVLRGGYVDILVTDERALAAVATALGLAPAGLGTTGLGPTRAVR